MRNDMYFKNCPFCNQTVDYTYNNENKKYIMCCKNCLQHGITISIQADNLDEIQKLWNHRVFDDLLLNEPEYSIKLLSFYNGSLKIPTDIVKMKNDKDHMSFDSFNCSEDIFGYMVTPSGDIIVCDDEHCQELMRFLGFDTDEMELDNDTVMSSAIQYGIIRISKQSKCLMFDIVPSKVNKKQITSLIEFLATNSNKLGYIRTYCVYLNGGTKVDDVKVFDTMNETILFLDKVK